jgi:hypothetical protein
MTSHNPDPTSYTNHLATDAASGSTEQGGDMLAMLRDAFDMHEVREHNRGLESTEQVSEENINEEPAVGGTQKY